VVCNRFWHPLIQPAAMQAASSGREVFGYSEYESVNTALAFQYRNGALVWQLSHQLDEGREHLAVEGAAPAATRALLAAAIEAGAREGHDAVFGVPGAVLRAASGIELPAGGARYHRLAPDPAAALPPDQDAMAARLTGALAQALQPLGFARVATDPLGAAWDSLLRTDAAGTQYLRPFVWQRDGYFDCDAWLEIRDTRVEQVLEKFTPDDTGKPTATLAFSTFAGAKACAVDSPAGLAALVDHMRRQFAELLPASADMARLDALVNGDSDEVDFMKMLESYAPFIVAWLGGNPRFDTMIAKGNERVHLEPGESETGLMQMARYLRERGRG